MLWCLAAVLSGCTPECSKSTSVDAHPGPQVRAPLSASTGGPAGLAASPSAVTEEAQELRSHHSGLLDIPGGNIAACTASSLSEDHPECPETPSHIDQFRMQKSEVSVREYWACVDVGRCSVPRISSSLHGCNWRGAPSPHGDSSRLGHPMNCITRPQAEAYCKYVGLGLPTRIQWQRAARGPDQRLYPWGNEMVKWDVAKGLSGCVRQRTGTCLVSQSSGYEPFGLNNISGNVAEWTASDSGDKLRPSEASCGSSWLDPLLDAPEMLSLAACDNHPVGYRSAKVGVRCVRKPGPGTPPGLKPREE